MPIDTTPTLNTACAAPAAPPLPQHPPPTHTTQPDGALTLTLTPTVGRGGSLWLVVHHWEGARGCSFSSKALLLQFFFLLVPDEEDIREIKNYSRQALFYVSLLSASEYDPLSLLPPRSVCCQCVDELITLFPT